MSSRMCNGSGIRIGNCVLATCIAALPFLGSSSDSIYAQDTLVYSFENDLEGFAANGFGITVSRDTIGATDGSHSMKVAITGPTFVGANTGLLHPAIGDPPGLDHVTFDLTLDTAFPEGGFAVVGVMVFGVGQDGTAVQLQTGPSEDPALEFHLDGLAPGTYRDITIDMTQFVHPITFHDIVGTLGSGPNDVVPTGFQLYFNKTGGLGFPLTVYIDNVRVGTTQAAIDGDYNGNGTVDAADFTVWRDNRGLIGGATPAKGDGTLDGNVLDDDYTFWKSRFGNPVGSGLLTANVVPEPSAMVLFLLTSLISGMFPRQIKNTD
jgi:hypothetical protein